MNKKKLLTIGAITVPSKKNTLGGCTVLTDNLLDFCRSHGVDFVHIPTNRFEGKFAFLFNSIYLFWRVLLNLRKVHTVMFNVSYNGALKVFPLLTPLCKLFRTKVVFRVYGGYFDERYKRSGFLTRYLSKKALNSADLIYTETNGLINFFRTIVSQGDRVLKFPNVRCAPATVRTGKYRKRFVFLSRILEMKGVDLILEAIKSSPDPEITCDFYGPFTESKYNEAYFDSPRTSYKGVVAPYDVPQVLSNYDVLLLPTFHPGEGYPGIIIEAMAVGLPSITTKSRFIPEFVSDRHDGILIPPNDLDSLKKAIAEMDDSQYQYLATNALKKFREELESETVNSKILGRILSLTGRTL